MTTTLTTAEADAIIKFAKSSVEDANSETALMLILEPSVSAQLSEGVSLDAIKARVFKMVGEYAETLNKNTSDYGFLAAMMESNGRTKLGRIVKNIERRQIVKPIFDHVEVDIDLARADFLDHWGAMSKAAIAVDMDLADMVNDHVVPNASAKGKLKGQFTRQTAKKVVAELKPEAAPAPSENDEGEEAEETNEVVEIPQGSLINVWTDFESKVFPQKDTMTDEERQYLIDGMLGLIDTLS